LLALQFAGIKLAMISPNVAVEMHLKTLKQYSRAGIR
jgi:hypothetical protein